MIVIYYYADHVGEGSIESQSVSKAFVDIVKQHYDVVEFAQRGVNAWDRMEHLQQIWGQDDLFLWESTKCPTIQLLKDIDLCDGLLCSLLWYANVPVGNQILRLPNHRDYSDGCDCRDYSKMSMMNDRHCHYVIKPIGAQQYCDVSDTGAIKISKKLQQHTLPDFEPSDSQLDKYKALQEIQTTFLRWMVKHNQVFHRHGECYRDGRIGVMTDRFHPKAHLTVEQWKQTHRG